MTRSARRGDAALELDPARAGWCRPRALVAALHHAERVERVDHGHAAAPRRRVERRQPGHPEVGVHHVRRRRRAHCVARAPSANAAHVRQQLVLGDRLGGPGVDVLAPSTPGRERHPLAAARGRRGACGPPPRRPRRASAVAELPRRARSGRRRPRRRARRAGSRARRPSSILIRSPPRGRRPSRPGSAPARSARAPHRRAARARLARPPPRRPRAARAASPRTSIRFETTPASGGTASTTSVVASATTGMPRCIASISDRPSEVQRIGCRYTRRRAISSCSRSCGRSSIPSMAVPPTASAPMPNTSIGTALRERLQQVGAGDPPAPRRLVDHDGRTGQSPVVPRRPGRRSRARPPASAWRPRPRRGG